MIFEGDFYYFDKLRCNFGWPTPNYAGALLASIIPILFSFTNGRLRWIMLTVEAIVVFLLVKTYSRGAVVSLLVGWIFMALRARIWRERRLIWWLILRIVILFMMLYGLGFGWNRNVQRSEMAAIDRNILDGNVAEDGSVVNRLALWRGGVVMIAAEPWKGWGGGESGRAYMNWFQDVKRSEGFTTMVNSYLHVGVEYGAGALALALGGLGFLLTLSLQVPQLERVTDGGGLGLSSISLAAGGSLVAWATANVFTTLWLDWRLWIVPALSAGIILWNVGRGRGIVTVGLILRRAILYSFVATVGVALGIILVGNVIARKFPLHVEPGEKGTLLVRATDGVFDAKRAWHVWPDRTVLGATPGKEIRRWLFSLPHPHQLIVHRSEEYVDWSNLTDSAGVMFVGRQAERLGKRQSGGPHAYLLLHPLGVPPPATAWVGGAVVVVLPSIDETGGGGTWRAWAGTIGARVITSVGTGLDIRSVWPEVALTGGVL